MARCMRARVRCPLAMPIEIQTIVATPTPQFGPPQLVPTRAHPNRRPAGRPEYARLPASYSELPRGAATTTNEHEHVF